MTLLTLISLALAMTALALVPSTSVALVVARSATAGVRQGVAVAAGIVSGDLVLMLVAALGLVALAHTLGPLFVVIRYAAALYLLVLGFQLVRSAAPAWASSRALAGKPHLGASFLAGLLVTLGDIKAIFFYASLLPAFVELATLTVADLAWMAAVTLLSVGGVKLGYALAAHRLARHLSDARWARHARPLAGGVMLGAGGYLAFKP